MSATPLTEPRWYHRERFPKLAWPASRAKQQSSPAPVVESDEPSRFVSRRTAPASFTGARVDQEALDRAVREITGSGAEAASLPLDLRMPDAPRRLAEFALQTFGQIDIVVNNAGATKRGEFEDLTEEDWADGYALKFFGAVRLTRAAWPYLKATSGSLINISGIGGRTPEAQFTIGGSVNAALTSFTKAMAAAGIVNDVQVNVINPGTIRTDRYQKRLVAFAAEHGMDTASRSRARIT